MRMRNVFFYFVMLMIMMGLPGKYRNSGKNLRHRGFTSKMWRKSVVEYRGEVTNYVAECSLI